MEENKDWFEIISNVESMEDYRDLHVSLINQEGIDSLLFDACEEMVKLIQAINKYRKEITVENRAHLIEAVADVQIAIDQIQVIAGFFYGHELVEKKEEKIEKIKNRLEGDIL